MITDFHHSKGEKVTAKAHGGPIDIQGVTVATVDDKVRLQSVDTWFDPLEMFRQIAPGGIVNKETMNRKVNPEDALDTSTATSIPNNNGLKIAQEHNDPASAHANDKAPEDVLPKHISNSTGQPADAFVPHQGADTQEPANGHSNGHATEPEIESQHIVASAATHGAAAPLSHPESNLSSPPSTAQTSAGAPTGSTPSTVDESRATGTHDAIDAHLESSAAKVHPHPHDAEEAVKPAAGEAVAAPAQSAETRMTHEEMSRLGGAGGNGAGECPFLMNRE